MQRVLIDGLIILTFTISMLILNVVSPRPDPAVSTAARLAPQIPAHVQNVAGLPYPVLSWTDPDYPAVRCYALQASISCVSVR